MQAFEVFIFRCRKIFMFFGYISVFERENSKTTR